MPSRYLVRKSDVAPYAPANHTGTRNFRLIGAETVGAKNLEVLIGEVERGKGALPHSHPGIEQVCYLLEGAAQVEVAGDAFEMQQGRLLLFSRRRASCIHGDQRQRAGDGDLLAALRRGPRQGQAHRRTLTALHPPPMPRKRSAFARVMASSSAASKSARSSVPSGSSSPMLNG